MTVEPRFDLSDPEVPYDEEYLATALTEGRDTTCIRAAREDDDGYDPYSDRQAVQPLFERDPWD